MKIVVIGGTGLIGSKVVADLVARGVETTAASLDTGVDTLTGAGLAEAVAGATTVIDASNASPSDPGAALEFFRRSTANLLAAEAGAGVRHHVVLSIVGASDLATSPYFEGKLAQERLSSESAIPHTVVRGTQLFEFLPQIADALTDGELVRVPPVWTQPVAVDDLAHALAGVARGEPHHQVVEVCGPEPFPLDHLLRRVLEAADDRRRVVLDPDARYFGAALRERSLLPGDHALSCPTRFADWFERRLATT